MSAMPAQPPPLIGRRRFLAGLGGLLLVAGLGIHSPRLQAGIDRARLRDNMQRLYGSRGLNTLEEWFSLLDRLDGADLNTQLREVNDFFNSRVRWLDDIDIWGQEDYWATPLETMGKREGDCEDYSIAKYVTLKEIGVPGDRLRMIYVKARLGRGNLTQAHMVLGYYETPGADPRILDNLVKSIRPGSQRTDLDPVFSFNSTGLWTGSSTQSQADPVARLSRWRNAISRMQEHGFV
ncbi:MAG: transglutaminase-like cysteine peptidase [Pseudomonadota bacterium]